MLLKSRNLFVVVAIASALLGCPRKKADVNDGGGGPALASASANASSQATLGGRDAGPAAVDEPPLRWGTRPPRSAELYVALDGPCDAMTVFTVQDGTIALYEGAKFGRVTKDGFDIDVSTGFEKLKLEEEHEGIDAVAGRLDDLWTANMGGGSVFREASSARRKDGLWKIVAPLGLKDMHYTAPESWRGGAVGLAIVAKDGDAGDVKVVGYDLPKEIVVGKLFPADVRLYQLHALDSGELLAYGRASGKSVVLMLGPTDTSARTLSITTTADDLVKLSGRSRKTFRVDNGKKRYRLEKDDLVEEEVDNPLEWRANGKTLQHLVGAGYQDVVLPPMPMSNASAVSFDTLSLAPDGEAIVSVSWTGKSEIASSTVFHGLLRSRRPVETLRCSEHLAGDGSWETNYKPATATGLEHWPPRATESCATPFVIVARYGHRDRVPADLPKAKAAIGKHEATTGVSASAVAFVTVDTGGRRVIGIRASSFAQAKHIAEALTQDLRLEPEIVCADPEASTHPDGG